MIKCQLIFALDFAKPKKKDKQEHGQSSRLCDGTWFVYKFGPVFSNTFRVHEFDEDGLKWLKEHEEKSDIPPTAKGTK